MLSLFNAFLPLAFQGDQGQDGLKMGIDSVVAIPLEDFSLDLVKPEAQCVKRDGVCIPFVFPNAPDGSVILPFVGPNAGRPATYLPARIHVSTSLCKKMFLLRENEANAGEV